MSVRADGGGFNLGQSIANSPAEIRRLRHRKRYTIPLIHFSELPTGISVKEFVHNHSNSIRKQKQALKNLSGPHYYPFEIRNNGAIRFHHGGHLIEQRRNSPACYPIVHPDLVPATSIQRTIKTHVKGRPLKLFVEGDSRN